MYKKLNIFLILFFIFFKVYSQQTNKISFEVGSVINNPLINGERFISNKQSTMFIDWTYKYYRSSGYFVKFSYDWKLISKNKWSLFFPMGISYMSQINKYQRYGYSWGCFGGESVNELKIVKNKNATLFLGLALQFESNKFRYSGNLILTNCLTVDSKSNSIPYNSNDANQNAYSKFEYNLYVSSQFSVLYKIKNNIWLGPSCELFYGNTLSVIDSMTDKMRPSQSFYGNYGPSINITGKNIWINPGIKLQIDLK